MSVLLRHTFVGLQLFVTKKSMVFQQQSIQFPQSQVELSERDLQRQNFVYQSNKVDIFQETNEKYWLNTEWLLLITKIDVVN